MIYTTTEQDSRDAACMLFKAVQWDNISRDGTESEIDGTSLFEVLPRALVTPFPHDPGGRLLELGMRAHEIVLAMHDQDTDSETRVGVYMQAIELRKRELAGWLAVRTPEYPEGDLLGAARVAVTLGGLLCEVSLLTLDKSFMSTGGKYLQDALVYTDRVNRVEYTGTKKNVARIRAAAHENLEACRMAIAQF